jgi:hypothetical protein
MELPLLDRSAMIAELMKAYGLESDWARSLFDRILGRRFDAASLTGSFSASHAVLHPDLPEASIRLSSRVGAP